MLDLEAGDKRVPPKFLHGIQTNILCLTHDSTLVCHNYWNRGSKPFTLLAVVSLSNWPAQIIQSSAGGFHSNHIECLTPHHQQTKICNQLCLANPTDKYARQWSISPPARSFTGSHICQLDLLGRVDYTVFVSWWCDVCYKLPVLGYSNSIKDIPSWLLKTIYWDFFRHSMEPNKDGWGCIFPLPGSCSIYTPLSTHQAGPE